MLFETSNLLLEALLFVIIFVSGYLLHRAGRPYKTGLLTFHKLLGLAALIFLGIMIDITQGLSAFEVNEITAVVLCAVFFILTIASGGAISTEKPARPIFGIFHRFMPYLTLLSAAALVLLLM